MSVNSSSIRIGIYAHDDANENERHGCGLWPAGYAAAVTQAGATPVSLIEFDADAEWDEILEGVHGVVFAGNDWTAEWHAADAEKLCEWCRQHHLPYLGIDHGMHVLNTSHGGTVHLNVARDMPEAIQHRHPPEKGLRHAINVERGTRLAHLYGEGEVVVNSEHRRAVCRPARGFKIGARALDGVIEAIEAEAEGWFALGVQWHPASTTASGLDIQLFRGLVEACGKGTHGSTRAARVHAA